MKSDMAISQYVVGYSILFFIFYTTHLPVGAEKLQKSL